MEGKGSLLYPPVVVVVVVVVVVSGFSVPLLSRDLAVYARV